ncbi:hypothetical protein ASF12_27560 [Paenibacillus sp. Leaf72]|nr:hypothetical protein ASF12_27560 [Paenibacillus sp. Leaf72]
MWFKKMVMKMAKRNERLELEKRSVRLKLSVGKQHRKHMLLPLRSPLLGAISRNARVMAIGSQAFHAVELFSFTLLIIR